MSAKESAVSAAAAELVWSGLGFLLLGLPLDEGDGRSSPTFRDSHSKISVVQISNVESRANYGAVGAWLQTDLRLTLKCDESWCHYR